MKNSKFLNFLLLICFLSFPNISDAKQSSEENDNRIQDIHSATNDIIIKCVNAIVDPIPAPKYLIPKDINTGNTSNLVLNFTSFVPDGWEVGIYMKDSIIVGSAVVINKQGLLVIWGQDSQKPTHGAPNGEVLTVRLLDTLFQKFETVTLLNIKEQISQKVYDTLKYIPNGVIIADGFLPSSDVKENYFELITNFRILPNPANNQFSISFLLTKLQKVNLSIEDIFGKEVVRLIDSENMDQGKYTLPCNLSLPEGVYFCRLRIDGMEQVLKLIMLK
jgi:hypothetical protein